MPTTTDVRVNDLIINKMTQEQYDALQEKSPTELYVVEGDSNVTYAEQAVELPTASESNLGKIYQYIGTTDTNYTNGYFYQNQSEYFPDLTIEQTVGSSLSNLTIDLDTFIETEQPTQDEIITFVRVEEGGDISVSPTTGTNHGITATIIDAELFWNQVQYDFAQWGTSDPLLYVNVEYGSSNWDKIKLQLHTANSSYNHAWYTRSEAEAFGVSVTGTLEGSYSYFAVISNIQAHESGRKYWKKDNVEVDPANYGISYEGTPEINDELTVTYIHSSISYKWNQVDVQPIPVIPDPLPDQTGQSGKFLTTDGTDASWSDKPLVNKATGTNSVCTYINTTYIRSTQFGSSAIINGNFTTGVGFDTRVGNSGTAVGAEAYATSGKNVGFGTAIGRAAHANGNASIALGSWATANGKHSIQIGGAGGIANYDDNTMNVCLGESLTQNYKLLLSDGTIPEARLADTTSATTGQVLQLDSNNNAVWADVDSLPSQSGQTGKILGTDGTNAAWETKTTISFRTWDANE